MSTQTNVSDFTEMSTQTDVEELSPENQSQMMDELEGATLSISRRNFLSIQQDAEDSDSHDRSSLNSSPINMNAQEKMNNKKNSQISDGRGDQLEKPV